MVKNHSDSERKPTANTWTTLSELGFCYMHHPTDRIIHTTAFVTPVLEHLLVRKIAQWVHHEGSIRRPIAHRRSTAELHLTQELN